MKMQTWLGQVYSGFQTQEKPPIMRCLAQIKKKIVGENTPKLKWPPIYPRQKNSSELVNDLTRLSGKNTYHIVPLLEGSIQEAKVQIFDENYRKVIASFEKQGKYVVLHSIVLPYSSAKRS